MLVRFSYTYYAHMKYFQWLCVSSIKTQKILLPFIPFHFQQYLQNQNTKCSIHSFNATFLCMKEKEIFLLHETPNQDIFVFKIAIICEGFQFNINFGLFRFLFQNCVAVRSFQMTDFIYPKILPNEKYINKYFSQFYCMIFIYVTSQNVKMRKREREIVKKKKKMDETNEMCSSRRLWKYIISFFLFVL